jgi:enamine deaminase RidA (YjgF/YER057c/UK114 family)
MAKQIINPPQMPAPRGYSYAVKKTGTPVFISGQVSIDERDQLVGENDAAAQVEQVFRNLRMVVEASGGTLDDVVKLNVYVRMPLARRWSRRVSATSGRAGIPPAPTSSSPRWRCRSCWWRSKRSR